MLLFFGRVKFAYRVMCLAVFFVSTSVFANNPKPTVLGMGHFTTQRCARPAVDPAFTRSDVKEWSAGFVEAVGHPADSGVHELPEPPRLPPPPDAVPIRVEPEKASRQKIEVPVDEITDDFENEVTAVINLQERTGRVQRVVKVVRTTSTQAIPEMIGAHSRYTSPRDAKKTPSELADEMEMDLLLHELALKKEPHYIDGIPYSAPESSKLPGENFIIEWKFDFSTMPPIDPRTNYNDLIPQELRPSLDPFDPAYPFFIGANNSPPNPEPGDYFWAPDFWGPLKPIPDYPVKTIFMAGGTKSENVDQEIIEKRVTAELDPGQHATKIGEGGASIVYAVHKKPPEKFIAIEAKEEGSAAGALIAERLKWAMEHAFKLIKIKFWSKHALEAMRRDHVVLRVLAQLAERVYKPNGKRLIRFVVPENEGLNRAITFVNAKDIIRGPKADTVKLMIDEFYSRGPYHNVATTRERQIEILKQFKRWKLPIDLNSKHHPFKKILIELGAVEKFFVQAHVYMLHVSLHLQTENIGDIDRQNIERMLTVDPKHGDNIRWSIDEMMWVGVDG